MPSELMADGVCCSADELAGLYRRIARFPVPCAAHVRHQKTGKEKTWRNIYTEWTQRDVERGESVMFCRHYQVHGNSTTEMETNSGDEATELHGQLWRRVSPSGSQTAILRKVPTKGGDDKNFLEVWSQSCKETCVDLLGLEKHGKVYDDDQFGCLSWSHSEKHLLYVAERRVPKAPSFFGSAVTSRTDGDECPPKGDKFVFQQDWGEGLVGKISGVLCVLDVQSCTVKVLEGVPHGVCPGQALWARGDEGVLFVGWYRDPWPLGLRYCSNRRSDLFFLNFETETCEVLGSGGGSVWAPRLSPDGRQLAFLWVLAGSTHRQCAELRLFDPEVSGVAVLGGGCVIFKIEMESKVEKVIVDIVNQPADAFAFPGLFAFSLTYRCWASDSRRLLCHTAWRSKQVLVVLDTETGVVNRLTTGGSWRLLDVDGKDLVIAASSSPNTPWTLSVGFLPARGTEGSMTWLSLDAAQPFAEIEWMVIPLQPPPAEDNQAYPGIKYEAILLAPFPSAMQKFPLVVYPHGGPHSVFSTEWMTFPAMLCLVRCVVLLVNYRGSCGFGQDSISSLLGNIGTQDVLDVQRAVEAACQRDDVDVRNVFLFGGSHGGFLGCHMIGQFPEQFRACVLRNPVIDLPSLAVVSDIPDWASVESGQEYDGTRALSEELLIAMRSKSPIVHASKIVTPTLLLVGQEDRRVPCSQATALYRVLLARGTPARMVWYPEDNHSLAKVDVEADSFLNIILWFGKHLLQPPLWSHVLEPPPPPRT